MKAEDSGNPPFSDSVVLTITVLDVNDNPPVFQTKFHNITVSENAPRGTHLITVKAIDPDNNQKIVYRLENSNKNIFSLIDLGDEVHFK